jgi:hypothetical protein
MLRKAEPKMQAKAIEEMTMLITESVLQNSFLALGVFRVSGREPGRSPGNGPQNSMPSFMKKNVLSPETP